ncbi:MAG TPA: hypothetical protein VHZ31_05085 [Solirubrobacteraceae bacterium]|jgi:predicted nucleotidyltransferase|nr:hypothetical protein [Solirubrobacteraceae bacterium]
MDPRSAALLDDPAGALAALAERTGAGFSALTAARRRTDGRVAERMADLERHAVGDDVATCVFGSWARGELTDGSDDDWAVLVARPFAAYDRDVCLEVVAATETLGVEERQPGSQDIFGHPFDVTELARKIGLDADTNTNLTRRMLLLLESRELHGNVRSGAITDILARYLHEGTKSYRPPRFLLNDLVRYWRTICVDFEGKGSAGAADPKWATRNAKLRTSRKLLFAGGLVTVLLCHLKEASEMPHFLGRWFDVAPTDRLAAAFLYAGVEESGARALGAYDRWLTLIGDSETREALRLVAFDTRDTSDLFETIRQIGMDFQAGLDALLFSSALGRVTRTYAIF